MLPTINLFDIAPEIKIYRCNSRLQVIGRIKEAETPSYDINVGKLNELSFTVPLYVDDLQQGRILNVNAESLVDRVVLKVKYNGIEEYFIINTHDDSDDNEIRTIHAFSLGYQLNGKLIKDYKSKKMVSDGQTTQEMEAPINIEDALQDALQKNRTWTVGYIDTALLEIYRYFEFDSVTPLDYVYQIGENFNAILVWDTVNRKIDAYHPDNYGTDKGFKITNNNYISNLVKKSSDDEFTTRLFLYGKDGLTVNAINPTGQSYIEDFSYFINNGEMSQDLIDALVSYNQYIDSRKTDFSILLDELKTKQQEWTVISTDLISLQINDLKVNDLVDTQKATGEYKRITQSISSTNKTIVQSFGANKRYVLFYKLNTTQNVNVYHNDQLVTWVNNQWNTIKFTDASNLLFENVTSNVDVQCAYVRITEDEFTNATIQVLMDKYNVDYVDELFATKQTELNNKQLEMDSVNQSITTLKNEVDMESHLTSDQLDELDYFIIEKDYVDENIIDDESLLIEGQKQLEERNKPQVLFDVGLLNFLQLLEEKRNWDKISLFDTVRIQSKKINVDIKAKIINMKIDSDSIGLTIANAKNAKDEDDKFIKLLYGTVSGTKSLQKKEYTWDEAYKVKDQFNDYINSAIDATKQKIVAGVNETVKITEKGIRVSSVDDPNTYLLINHGVIAITHDDGVTWENALTTEGLIASQVIGRLLVSSKLVIENEAGTFTVDGATVRIDGGSLIVDGGISESNIDTTSTTKWNNAEQNAIDTAKGYTDTQSQDGQNAWAKFSGTNNSLPAGTILWDGTTSEVVESTTLNFNTRNDRISIVPSNPLIATDGSAIDHTLNTDGSCDLSFEWNFTATGDTGDIDGFIVYLFQGVSSSAYSFGSSVASEQVFYVTPEKRAFILYGLPANRYYTFGVQAYRIVDKDINSMGVLKSSIVKSVATGENPYRPSATVAYLGDVIGTINGTEAETVASKANNALQLGVEYNKVTFDTNSGLTANRSDNKVRTIINATDGIKIQTSSNGVDWVDKLFVDTNGVINARGLVIANEDGTVALIDAKNKMIDFSQFLTITGKLNANNIQIGGSSTFEDGYNPTTVTPHQIVLSNENQSILTDSTGKTKSSIVVSSVVDFYKGSNRIVGTIGTLALKDNSGNVISTTGVTFSKVNPTATASGSLIMTINSGISLAVDSGYIEIPITIESNTYTKKLTWNKAKDGLNGTNGYTPTKGTDYFDGTNGTSSYLWVRYSQVSTGNPMTTDPTNAKYIGTAVTTTPTAPTGYASYSWSLVKGTDGVKGETGADGQTSYLHIKYSDNGTTFTANSGETVGAYIGTYVDFTQADSTTFGAYTWNKIKGADGYTPIKGTDYFDGLPGQNGTSNYLWVRYSQNATGNPMTTDPTGAKYIGTSVTTINTAPTGYASYSWSLIKGTDGIPGEPGANGQTSYLHIKYSDNGTTFTANVGEVVGSWIGTYVDFIQSDSTTFSTYTWNKVKGNDGYTPIKGVDYFDGVNGQKGADGINSYLWVKYSVNSSGNPMTDTPSGALYIGIATTTTPTAPSPYSSYKWSLIKGTDGVKGETGANGQTSYLHIKYSNDGGVNFTANSGETVGDWIGTYVDFTSADSNSVSAYTWNKVKGDKGDTGSQGLQGLQGTKGDQGLKGADGVSSYTHIAYATNSTGTTGFSVSDPTNKTYIGMYVDSIATDSTDATKYKWSLIKGADGSQGIQGQAGANGQTPYLHIAYATNSMGSTGFSTTDATGKTYIGTYTDFTASDSTTASMYTWVLIKGTDGANAKVADIVANNQVFKSTDGGATYSPTSITLTPTLQNVTFSKWQYSINGGSTFVDAVSGSNGITISSNILTLSKDSALFTSTVTSITFKLITNDSNVLDTLTIVKLYDVTDALADYVKTTVYGSGISGLQTQIDGKVETWFYSGVPNLTNNPTSTWTDNTTKDKHLNDLYFDTATKKVYRFKVVSGTYSWELLQDSDIQAALTNASTAQTTADKKMQVFTAQPIPPYGIGDLWVGGTSTDLMKCKTARASGLYVSSDWEKAVKYTDDSATNYLKTDLRMSAPLPVAISMDANGIKATTSDATSYAQMDYRGFFTKKGAFAVERSDGFVSISNGIIQNDFTIGGADPPFRANEVTISEFWWKTFDSTPRSCNYYTFMHNSRYLKILVASFSGGSGSKVSIFDTDGVTVLASLVTNDTNQTSSLALNGQVLTIDLGVPTGLQKSFYVRLNSGSVTGANAGYGRILRMWKEG